MDEWMEGWMDDRMEPERIDPEVAGVWGCGEGSGYKEEEEGGACMWLSALVVCWVVV